MKEVKDRVKIYERTLIFIRLGLTWKKVCGPSLGIRVSIQDPQEPAAQGQERGTAPSIPKWGTDGTKLSLEKLS